MRASTQHPQVVLKVNEHEEAKDRSCPGAEQDARRASVRGFAQF
jgi:hypothetical protein